MHFFIRAEGHREIVRQMKDLIEADRPRNIPVSRFIKLNYNASNKPISAKFEVIPNAQEILTAELGKVSLTLELQAKSNNFGRDLNPNWCKYSNFGLPDISENFLFF